MTNLRKIIIVTILLIVLVVTAVAPALARKVNEYEGQHIAMAGDPSQWGVAGDPSQWG